ncbi:MAG TPA: hypothetical protein VMH81_24950 [Bryobacteraceae bacterium]|nr:hypothetical protein [Bryobacteraceae bacterium]
MKIVFALIPGVVLWLTVVWYWKSRQTKRRRQSKLLAQAEL